MALCIAYFNSEKALSGLISSTLSPILGDKVNGPIGKLIDCIAVFATVVGVATSLGIGATQINGGLSYLFGIPNNFLVQFILIAIVTVLFLISAWSGLGKGIKYLSNTNMVLAGLLMLFVLFVGPTVLIMNSFTDSIGQYIQNIVQMSFRLTPYDPEKREWINGWTIFYWAWWIYGLHLSAFSSPGYPEDGRSVNFDRRLGNTMYSRVPMVLYLWRIGYGSSAERHIQCSEAVNGNDAVWNT